MATYNIHVKDKVSGEAISFAKIYLLQTEGGNAILQNGVPVAFETDADGNYTASAQPPLYVRVEATGYSAKNVSLQPLANVIELDGISGPTAVISSTRTFLSKYKYIILLLLAVAMVFIAVKYKILT